MSSYSDRYHINPRTGKVDKCRSQSGKCPFGAFDQHFREEKVAIRAAEGKFQELYAWTRKSRVPQEEGWYTEQAFDPDKPASLKYSSLALMDAPEGHRLVMENGWVLEKTDKRDYWNFIGGEDTRFKGLRKDRPNSSGLFAAELKIIGGRLEYSDELGPMIMNWRVH